MSKFKISAALIPAVLVFTEVAFALDKAHGNPAHHGPGWLSGLAALSGFILAWASVFLIYMMVSGKAGKYTE